MATSTARRSKAALPKPKAASYSTDDVFNLLKAVNEITLKRMEDKFDRFERNALNQIGATYSAASRIEGLLWAFTEGTNLQRMMREILAIKAKVGALTKGSTKGSRGRARKRSRSRTA